MRPKFTHVALLVNDVDKTADFYTHYCGLKVIERRVDPNTGYRVIWLSEEEEKLNFVIVAFESKDKPIQSITKPLSHLGFSLSSREEVNAIAQMAESEGRLNYGPVYFNKDVGYICEILDPDGNSVEFSFGQKLGQNS